MRISSGSAKNKKLIAPKIPGIRISQEIVRQAAFSIVGSKIKDAICLDLYAGSGSIGIEALSRGAEWCDFVDINPEASKTINENLKHTDLFLKSQVFTQDSLKYVLNCHKKYDLIFLDPYYDQIAHKHIFKSLPEIMNKEGLIVFLHGKELKIDKYLEDTVLKLGEERRYGATNVSFISVDTSR
ncbi:hypothetical protein A2716_01420 [candidate division WWE3 bacterium RIFCSPHIGHO2_01_FULL_40_23]|uniref:16S rRNA (Guanine(966)-N(2))-methyltransferase RsmD n=1 Tax=candidate division WWE3 bacterium RIFCSPLOWO2_01_FULL_41_18 TaxID=1802625 RepID=A0A1F4VEM8_UNCKA|nr:MAG: hypothetical protein A2716_01420 [candidate division WWE3 bacterium RIFCSPHIGHO2_01_FULL_40_23]OGC55390.1 MAG: hypothetical protein A3A78_00325 [candidate division WWE3 bacterium RIFCSPLOWO2_01_FULL_41_18]